MLMQSRRFPLFVAVAAFAFYAATMGTGLNLNAVPLASKLAGWDPIPFVGQPVLWLVTLPLRILPLPWLPLGLKSLAALLASATLGLVTRTVQLLPWDHSWDSATKLASGLPLLAALAVCGLDFSYWQAASSTCDQLLGLFLLATAVWLLFEYNLRGDARWLRAAVIVWGTGMAEDWLILLGFPLFVIGIIWVERLRFFRWKFILPQAALGLGSYLIAYIFLPLINGLLPNSPWTFRQSWMESLHQTKIAIIIPFELCHAHKLLAMGLAISFLVPALPLIVRMRDEGTHNKSGADNFQLWIYRLLRLGLLLVCLWLAFDPTPGARQMMRSEIGVHLPLLTFDYINAVGAAFLMGNLLLVSQTIFRDQSRSSRRRLPCRQIIAPVSAAVLALVVIGLAIRNAPAIVYSNFHPLDEFGDIAVKSLPPGPGVVLGDYSDKLRFFSLALQRSGIKNWQAVDTRDLPSVACRAQLDRDQPAGWLTDKTRHELSPVETLQLIKEIARTNRVFYLPPSYGIFFEAFYAVPVGALYELKPRGSDPLDLPALSDHEIERNEQFWTSLWNKELSSLAASQKPSGRTVSIAKLGVIPPALDEDRVLGDWISIPLDAWAVALQVSGHLRESQLRLEQSIQLDSNNIASRVTLVCNTNLQAGIKFGMQDLNRVANQLGTTDRITNILSNCGPFDEPNLDYISGALFYSHGLLIQAASQLERTRALTSEPAAAELTLAEIYNQLQMPARSRPLIARVRRELPGSFTNSALDLNLALLDSNAALMQSNAAGAVSILRAVTVRHPDDPTVANRVLAAYVALNDVTNALSLIDQQLSNAPQNVAALNSKAVVLMQFSRPAEALPILDHVLMLTNDPEARANRAFAQIAIQNYALAKTDLHTLQRQQAAPAMVNFGLALVAEHEADTNAARAYFHQCLSNTPSGTQLAQRAAAYLRALEPSGSKQP